MAFFVMSFRARVDTAAPAMPPAPVWLVPPFPPAAYCRRVRVPPVVVPLAALVSVEPTPAPPVAPSLPSPPEPPVWLTVA